MKTDKIKQKVLVVGAGFAGAVIARELAEKGFLVDVIDSREHIAGNCYDPVDTRYKVRIHKYGPHIFHTNDTGIVNYLSAFTQWVHYRHKVEAYVEGVGFVPFPINMETINKLYNKNLSNKEEMQNFLAGLSENHKQADNARLYAENIYGKELVDLFFARYTKKMWDLELEQLPASIIARIPVRYDNNGNYFNDQFQAMPENGYTELFNNLLNHPAIHISLETGFDRAMEKDYFHVFNSMAIDEYYNNEFGALEYRSIKYRTETKSSHIQPVPTVNLTDNSPVTRYTQWDLYPGCNFKSDNSEGLKTVVTSEYPCSYLDNNNERYYPVKTVDETPQKRFRKYQQLAQDNKKCTFIGRCGQYRYLDMHQVVANSLMISRQFVK